MPGLGAQGSGLKSQNPLLVHSETFPAMSRAPNGLLSRGWLDTGQVLTCPLVVVLNLEAPDQQSWSSGASLPHA
jgi:hypothetical protein